MLMKSSKDLLQNQFESTKNQDT